MADQPPTVTASSSEDRECRICNEIYGERERAKRLACGHIFGRRCIRQWLHNHNTCPTCRNDVVRDALHPAFTGSHVSIEWTTPPIEDVVSTCREPTLQPRQASSQGITVPPYNLPVVGDQWRSPEALADRARVFEPLPSHISASEFRELMHTDLSQWSIWALRRLRQRIFQEITQRSEISREDLDRLYRRVRRAKYDSWEDGSQVQVAPLSPSAARGQSHTAERSDNGYNSVNGRRDHPSSPSGTSSRMPLERNPSRHPSRPTRVSARQSTVNNTSSRYPADDLERIIPVVEENWSPRPSPTRNSSTRPTDRDRSNRYMPRESGRSVLMEEKQASALRPSPRHRDRDSQTSTRSSRHHDRSHGSRSPTVRSSRHSHERGPSRTRPRSNTPRPPARDSSTGGAALQQATTVLEEEPSLSTDSSSCAPSRSSTIRNSRIAEWLHAVPKEQSQPTRTGSRRRTGQNDLAGFSEALQVWLRTGRGRITQR